MAHAARRDAAVAKRALEELLAASGPSFSRRRRPEAAVWLLFVRLDRLSLTSDFADTRLQLRVRFGNSGIYQEKHSAKVRSSGPVAGAQQEGALVQLQHLQGSTDLNGTLGILQDFDAERGRWQVALLDDDVKAVKPEHLRCAGESRASVGAMLAFRYDAEMPQMIVLDLIKLGFMDTVVASAAVRLPFSRGQRGVAEQECLFIKRRSTGCCLAPRKKDPSGSTPEALLIGHLGVTVELRDFSQDELELGLADATSIEFLLSMMDMLFEAAEQEAREQERAAEAAAARRQAGRQAPGAVAPNGHLGTPVPASAVAGATPMVVGRPIPGTGWSTWPRRRPEGPAASGSRPPMP